MLYDKLYQSLCSYNIFLYTYAQGEIQEIYVCITISTLSIYICTNLKVQNKRRISILKNVNCFFLNFLIIL